MQLQYNIKKIEFNIKNSISKYDYVRILRKIEAEIKRINDNIDKMYVDKLNGKINKNY